MILYEDMARRRVKALVASIRDLQVGGCGHQGPAGNRILWEGKRERLREGISSIKCCALTQPSSASSPYRSIQAVHAAVCEFQAVQDDVDSALLLHLMGDTSEEGSGRGALGPSPSPSFSWRGVAEALGKLSGAADWPEAERSGRVVPSRVSGADGPD